MKTEYIVKIGGAYVSAFDEDDPPIWLSLALNIEAAESVPSAFANKIAKAWGGAVLKRKTTVTYEDARSNP